MPTHLTIGMKVRLNLHQTAHEGCQVEDLDKCIGTITKIDGLGDFKYFVEFKFGDCRKTHNFKCSELSYCNGHYDFEF